MIPASASSQSEEPHQSRDRGTVCKEKRATSCMLTVNKHVTMTLLLNKRQQPYHTNVEHTAPHRRGGAN